MEILRVSDGAARHGGLQALAVTAVPLDTPMIVTRTPFRITLGGGSTDLPSYYTKHGGFVVAMGIDKYMYISMNPPLVDRKIRLQYTKSEVVDHPDQLRHQLARAALKKHNIYSRMEISSIADLPAGTGLGSSSCYLVGLLTALRAYRGTQCSQQELAAEAFDIERELRHEATGKQDQYMAVFGGLTVLDISKDGTVEVREVRVNTSSISEFMTNTHLYFIGLARSGTTALEEQDAAMREEGGASHTIVEESLHRIKELGYQSLAAIESENYDEFGRLMDEHWEQKKNLSPKVVLPGVDGLYEELKTRFGVLGAKVSGAGGGGFFMVYAPTNHRELNDFMESNGLHRLQYDMEYQGSKVISNSGSSSSGMLDHDSLEI